MSGVQAHPKGHSSHDYLELASTELLLYPLTLLRYKTAIKTVHALCSWMQLSEDLHTRAYSRLSLSEVGLESTRQKVFSCSITVCTYGHEHRQL